MPHINEDGIDVVLEADSVSPDFEDRLMRRLMGNIKVTAHETQITDSLIVRVRVEKK